MDAAAIQYAKGKGLAELAKQGVPAIEGSLDIFDRRAVEWLRDYQFELIQRITEDIRYGIKGSVMQGIFIGEDNQKIANRIRNYVTEPMPIYRKKDMLLVEQGVKTVDQIKPIRIISPEYRSMMISRTESIRVFNQANLSRYMESGVQKVEMSRHAGECKFCVEIRESGPWEISQSPYLPIHPHCRHSYLPIIDPKGLMRDLRDLGAQNYHDTIGEAPLQAGMDFLGNWAPKQIDAVKKNFNALPDHLRSSKFMDEGLIQMDPLQHFGSKIVDGRHVIVGEGWETERIVQELLNSYGRNWYGRYKKDLLQLGKKVDEIRFGEYFARYALHPNTIKDKDILQFFDEKVWRKNVPKKIPKKAVETPKPKPGKLTVEVPKFSAIGEVEEGAHDVLRVIDSEGNQWHVKALDSRRAKVEYEAWRLAKDLNLKTYDEVADIAVNQADQGLVQEMKKISKMIISPTDHLILTKNIGKKEDDLRLLMEAGEEHIIPVLQRNEEDVKKMFLFDLLTGNVDRNWGNAYYTKKGIYAIDHELVGGASVAGMVNHPAVALWDKQVIPRSFDDFWAAEFTDLVKKYEKIDLSNYNFGDAANRILKENQGNLRNNAYDFFAMNDMWRKDPTRKMYVDIRGDFSIEQKAVINKAFDIIPDNLKTREFYYVKGAGVDDYLGPGKMQLPIDGNDEALKKLLYYYFGKSLFYDNKFKTIANDEMLGTAFREYMLHGENVKGLEKEIKEMMNVLDIRNKTPADYLTGPIPQFKRFLDLDDHEAAGMNRMWKIEDSNGDIWYIKSSSVVEEVMGEKVGFITAKELGIETYPEMRFVRTEDLDPALRITPKGREGYFIYTKEIPNVESLAYLGASPSRDILDTIATHEDDINKIFTMDILVKNSDRHYGNILLRQDIDNLAAIDHGLIFAYGTINQPFDHLMYGKLTRGEFDNWFEKALKPLIDKVDTNELLEEFRKAGLSSGELTEATRVVGGSKAYFKRDVLDFFERRGMFKPEKEVAQDFVQDVSFHGNHIPKYFREDMQKFYDNLPTDLQVPVTFREMKETGKVADNEVMVLRHLHKGDDLVNAGIEGYGYVLAKKYNLDADVFAKEFKDYVAGKKVKVHQNFLDEKFGKVKISKSKVVPPTPKPSAPSIATTPKLSFGDKLPKSFKEDISKWYDQLPTELKQEATFTRMGGKATSAPGEFKVPYNLKKDDLIRISIEDYAKELYPKIVKASDNIAEDQFIQGFRQYTRGEFVTYSNVNEFLTKKFKKDTPAPEPIKPPKIFDQTSVPLKVTDNTWVQSKNIDELQENIKNLDFEVHAQFKNDGTLLYLAKGDKSQVEYNPRMLNKGDADVMVHNHPSGVPFSATDIESHIKRIADDSLANPRDLLISKDKVLELDVTDIKKWNKNKKNFKADFRKVHTEHMKQVPGIARKEAVSIDTEMDILSAPKYAPIQGKDGLLDFGKTKENMALFEQYKVDFKTLQDERVAEKRFEMLMPEINRLGERYGFKVVDYGNVSVTDAIKGVGVPKKLVELDPFLKGQLNPGSLEHIERTLGKIPDTVKLDNKVIIKLDNNVPEDDIFRIDYKGDKDNIIIRLAGVDPEFVDQQIAMGYGAAFAIKNKIPDPEDFGSNFVSYLAKDYDALSKPDKRDLDNIFKTGKHLEAPKAKPKSVSVPPKTKYITKDVDEFNIKEWGNLDRAESEYREALNDYKKMTKIDQEASIKYMDNFGKVNRTLWSGKETEMTKYLQENFDPVFEKYTLTENSVFWRKSDAKLFEKLKEGDIDSFKGYSSTTMVEDYMEDAYGHFSDRYSVRIIAPEGTEALQINNIGKLYGDELWKDNFEWEYLLKRDQQFQVLDIDKDSRTATIQLLVPEKKAVKEVSKDFVPEVRFIDKLKGEKLIQEGYDKLPDNLKYRIEVDGKADYLPEADIEQGIISVISESPKDLQLEEFYEGYGRILFNNDNFIRERYLLREGMEEVDMNPGDLLEFEENFARDFSDYLTRGTAEDPTFFKVLLKGELEEATKINLGEIDRTGYRVFEDETIPERLKALHNLTSKKLEDKLKTKQIDAIDEYKDPNLQTYKEINARLRGQLTDKDLDSESLKRIDDLTNEIQDAVTSYSLPEDTILHRVLGSNDKWADLEPGDVYTEKAFSSTSLRDETPIQKPWRAEILAPEGTKGLYVETIGIKLNEDEFLMPYGTSFQVLAVDPLENRIVFQVIPEKEIAKDFDIPDKVMKKEKFTVAYYHDKDKIAEYFILEKGTTEEFDAFLDRAGDKKIYTIKDKDI